jgi:hypothetical protein
MTRKLPLVTTVTKRVAAKRAVVEAKYPTGGSVKLRITRTCESLEVGGNDDPVQCEHEARTIGHWAESLTGETTDDRVARIADMLGRYSSVASLVQALEGA